MAFLFIKKYLILEGTETISDFQQSGIKNFRFVDPVHIF